MTLSQILEKSEITCLVFKCIPPSHSNRKEIAITYSDGTIDDEKRNEENAVEACDVIIISDHKRQLQSYREDIRAM
ncbi:Protein of unknown function [Pyronema omphalodes CBS 100304]|uniref:Uncharacterized protein n=1 Tax=Pyronema omphalodes (strain CBS 100304) TaxID=1076935 RepID=U4LVH2_PYROM|nr:Protein of unknown function [Pyronema omphalodes CBS 100304]